MTPALSMTVSSPPQSGSHSMRSTVLISRMVTVVPGFGVSAWSPSQAMASASGMLLGAVQYGVPPPGSQLSGHTTREPDTYPSPLSLHVSIALPAHSTSPDSHSMICVASGVAPSGVPGAASGSRSPPPPLAADGSNEHAGTPAQSRAKKTPVARRAIPPRPTPSGYRTAARLYSEQQLKAQLAHCASSVRRDVIAALAGERRVHAHPPAAAAAAAAPLARGGAVVPLLPGAGRPAGPGPPHPTARVAARPAVHHQPGPVE